MGCMPQQWLDITGKVFGRLEAQERVKGGKRSYWRCLCSCGQTTTTRLDQLLSGHTQSCGCLYREVAGKHKFKHGKIKTRLYSKWLTMKFRCSNPNATGFKNYGGRSIAVCKQWRDSFQAFYDWAITHGYEDGLTIHRINNDGGYSPQNCKWATMKEQNQHKRPRTHRTHCKRGHLMSDDNVVGAKRRCKICLLERNRKHDEKRRSAPEQLERINAQRRERYQKSH